MKKAYDNWMHVIEYDGKSLINDNEDKALDTTHPQAPMTSHEYSNSLQQISIPALPLPVHPGQPSMDSGVTVGGIYFLLKKIVSNKIKRVISGLNFFYPPSFSFFSRCFYFIFFFTIVFFILFIHPVPIILISSKPNFSQSGKI